MLKLSLLLSALLVVSAVLADLTCSNLTPEGRRNNHIKVHFYGDDGYSAPTLPANASVGNHWQLSNTTSKGATFYVKACNSTSLGVSSPQVQSSCSHSGCYHAYTNYVQLINPSTGHCLTSLNYKAAASKLGFKTCDAAATNFYQLFETDQQVLYTMGYQALTSYGDVDFNPINLGQPPDPPFQAWTLDKSYKSIELIQYDYTQDGLFAVLEQA